MTQRREAGQAFRLPADGLISGPLPTPTRLASRLALTTAPAARPTPPLAGRYPGRRGFSVDGLATYPTVASASRATMPAAMALLFSTEAET